MTLVIETPLEIRESLGNGRGGGVLAVGRTLGNASLGNGGSLGRGFLGNRKESLDIGVLLAMGPMAVTGSLGNGVSLRVGRPLMMDPLAMRDKEGGPLVVRGP